MKRVVKTKKDNFFLNFFFHCSFYKKKKIFGCARHIPLLPNLGLRGGSQDAQTGLSFPLDLKAKLAKRSGEWLIRSHIIPAGERRTAGGQDK